MTGKPRKTVTLSEEAKAILEKEDNASAVVTDLVEQYGRSGERGTAGLRLQRKHKARELEQALETVERLETELEDIDELIEEYEVERSDEWQQAKDALEHTPKDPENDAIKHWARKLNVTPEDLIDEIQ